MFCTTCNKAHQNAGQHGGYPTFPTANPYDTLADIPAESDEHKCHAVGCDNTWQTLVMSAFFGVPLHLCFLHYRIVYAAN